MDNSSGTFFPINPLPNTLVVNLGEMATVILITTIIFKKLKICTKFFQPNYIIKNVFEIVDFCFHWTDMEQWKDV